MSPRAHLTPTYPDPNPHPTPKANPNPNPNHTASLVLAPSLTLALPSREPNMRQGLGLEIATPGRTWVFWPRTTTSRRARAQLRPMLAELREIRRERWGER